MPWRLRSFWRRSTTRRTNRWDSAGEFTQNKIGLLLCSHWHNYANRLHLWRTKRQYTCPMKTYSLLAIGPLGIPELIVMAAVIAVLIFWIWAWIDCVKFERGNALCTWLLGILLLGPVIAPIYLLARTAFRREPEPDHSEEFRCCRCDGVHQQAPKVNFFGLRKFDCSACGTANKYPAAEPIRTACWIVLAIAAIGLVGGAYTLLVVPGLAIIWAFMSTNGSLRWASKVKRAQEFHFSRRFAQHVSSPRMPGHRPQ